MAKRPDPIAKHTVNLRIDYQTYTKLKNYAASRERSFSFVVNQILNKAAAKLPEPGHPDAKVRVSAA